METLEPIGNNPKFKGRDINRFECGLRFVTKVYNISFDKSCYQNTYSQKIYYGIEGFNLFFAKEEPAIAETRIVYGKKSAKIKEENPWFVIVNTKALRIFKKGSKDVSFCGGSVIHSHFVVTAAHCLENRVTPG